MATRKVVALLCLGAVIIGVAIVEHVAEPRVIATAAAREAELRSLYHRFDVAIVAHDVDTIMGFYEPDFEYYGFGKAVESKDVVAASLRPIHPSSSTTTIDRLEPAAFGAFVEEHTIWVFDHVTDYATTRDAWKWTNLGWRLCSTVELRRAVLERGGP